MSRNLNETETWEILKPICRELSQLVDEKKIVFVSAQENGDGSFTVKLKATWLHFAARGFRDSIADIEYDAGGVRMGLRSNGRPGNVYVEPA